MNGIRVVNLKEKTCILSPPLRFREEKKKQSEMNHTPTLRPPNLGNPPRHQKRAVEINGFFSAIFFFFGTDIRELFRNAHSRRGSDSTVRANQRQTRTERRRKRRWTAMANSKASVSPHDRRYIRRTANDNLRR